MRKSTAFATLLIATALAAPGSALAQSYFRCSTDGPFSGIFKADGNTLQVWNANSGWQPDLCRTEYVCVFTDQAYNLSHTREHRYRGRPARWEISLTIERRTGALTRHGASTDLATSDTNFAEHDTGECEPTDEPRLAAPRF